MIRALSLVFFLACTLGVGATPRAFAPVFLRVGSVNEVYLWDEEPLPAFTVEVRRQGSEEPFLQAKGFTVDRPLSVLGAGNRPLRWSAALLSPEVLASPGPVRLTFLGADKQVLAEALSEIRPRTFPLEKIPLDQTMSDLRSKPNARKDKEAAEIWKVYQSFHPQVRWPGGRFVRPVALAFPTSAEFGDVRLYQYVDGTSSRDYHRGTDFAVPVGTPVVVPAAGTVALSADRLLTGKTIVLEHAPGVYSVYFHLSKSLVKKGQVVTAGAPLALSGASGLVTGPHLHWEVRIDGIPVDPLDFVTDGLLDTRAVSAVISSVERSIH